MVNLCAVCKKPIDETTETVRCNICDAVMHKSCASDEALMDANENILCPYDAMLAALDWFDAVLITYVDTLEAEQRDGIIRRLRSYLNILEDQKAR